MSQVSSLPRSQSPLLTLDAALDRILARGTQIGSRTVRSLPLDQALGAVLANDVRSTLNVPPSDVSAMDGFAVRVSDVDKPGVRLRISQRITAGGQATALQASTAARIFTGAPVPHGADAVIPQEQCALEGDEVVIQQVPAMRAWIRGCGEDVKLGDVVLSRSERLTPQALGLLASVGVAQVEVMPRLRVALITTGNELTQPGEVLRPGAIYDANRYLLTALLQTCGVDIVDTVHIPDDLDLTRATLRRMAAAVDVIVSCGGVSVGDEDHLRAAVQAEGQLDLWQVAIKPGKPFACGHVRREGGEALFVGLPGNPVSAFVTFALLVRPLLLKLQGAAPKEPLSFAMRADFDWPGDRRREFLRVKCNAQGGLDRFDNQGSGVLTSVVWADGLVENPPEHAIARGDLVRFLPFAGWLS